ncbi:MAG: aminotransferase class V-fold PLP-dependent enzyme [Alphaproteobacteria bacterium]
MLSCQRPLFDIPEDVTYLASAATGPVPREVRLAGEAGLATKSTPWVRDPTIGSRTAEAARTAAARLIGAAPGDVAVVPAVSYAIATAGANLALDPKGRVLLMESEFPSQSYEWARLARERNVAVEVVARPADGDWTAALLAAIERPGAAPVTVAPLTPAHWTDGAMVDLDALAPALRRQGAALVIDATQAVGVLPVDVAALQPDFLVFPTYKWVLGSYSLAFLYAAPGRQDGRPLEQHDQARDRAAAPAAGPVAVPGFQGGARRYDMGERDSYTALPMAIAAFALNARWGIDAIRARLRHLTDALAERAAAAGFQVLDRRFRAPHILGVRVPTALGGAAAADRIAGALAAEKVFVSVRGGVLRIAPHVHVEDQEVDRFGAALARAAKVAA